MDGGAQPAAFGGVLLSLLTESFAVRALLGSLVAAGMAAVVVRTPRLRSRAARRLVVLAPITTAVAAGIWSLFDAEAYLPELWVTTAGVPSAGQVLELLGELQVVSPSRGVDVLVAAWALVACALLARRAAGLLAVRRLLRLARALDCRSPLAPAAARMAETMGQPSVRFLLLDGCPGGALTTGWRTPTVVVDPALLRALDARELDGLLAHELAHVARRDPLVGVLVGAFSDVTFFLPTVTLAGRWLRREQEESADDLASAATRRPAALASGILKVWERSGGTRSPAGACAAVSVRAPFTVPAVVQWLRDDGHSPAPRPVDRARLLTARVERLLEPVPASSARRRRAEMVLAMALLTVAVAVAVAVPKWIAADLDAAALSIGYVPPPAVPQESPAFDTFRALAPERADVMRRRMAPSPLAGKRAAAPAARYPLVESQAQLGRGRLPVSPTSRRELAWSRPGRAAWEMGPVDAAVRSARPLWTLHESGPALGLFVVAGEQAE